MNIRSNKGVTLMIETITILILMIIVSIISYSSMSSLQIKNLNNMYSDIVNIQEKAANYYLKYGKAPITTEMIPTDVVLDMVDELNPNDADGKYYKINYPLLKNISLNNKQTDESYYFINEKTLTVYFSEGVLIDRLNGGNVSKTYHTLPSNYEEIARLNVSYYQD